MKNSVRLFALILSLSLVSCGTEPQTEKPPVSTSQTGVTANSGTVSTSASSSGTEESVRQDPNELAASEAFSVRDVKKCAQTSSSGACVEAYWRMEATYGLNPRACGNIPNRKKAKECEAAGNAYVENFASEPSHCRKITDSSIRLQCSDKVSIAYARNSDDVSACDSLRTDDMKRSCRDDQYLKMAVS